MTRATRALVLMVENTVTWFVMVDASILWKIGMAGWLLKCLLSKLRAIVIKSKNFESVRPEFWSGLSYLLAVLIWTIYFPLCVSFFLHCKMRAMIGSISLGGVRVKWYTIYNLLSEVQSIKLSKINLNKVIFINSWLFSTEFTWYQVHTITYIINYAVFTHHQLCTLHS